MLLVFIRERGFLLLLLVRHCCIMVLILDFKTFGAVVSTSSEHLNTGVGMSLIYITEYFGMTLTPSTSQLGIVYLVRENIVFLDNYYEQLT